MSGPIVRRYGFPNFEKIFGERPIEHGADEPASPEEARADEAGAAGSRPDPSPAKPGAEAAGKGDAKVS